MRFPSGFAIFIGACMLAQWTWFLFSGSVPELHSEPVRLGFHLAAETLTALLLIVAGGAGLGSKRWARPLLLVSLGMLLYTVIVSPGYFAQRGQVGFVVMFAVIFALACVAIRAVVRSSLETKE